MYKMLLKTYCVVIFKNWNLIELIVVNKIIAKKKQRKKRTNEYENSQHKCTYLTFFLLKNSTVLELANWLMNA